MSGQIRHVRSFEGGGQAIAVQVTSTEDVDGTPDAPRDETHIHIETGLGLSEDQTIIVHLNDDDILYNGHPDREEAPSALLNHLANLYHNDQWHIVEQILKDWHANAIERYTA